MSEDGDDDHPPPSRSTDASQDQPSSSCRSHGKLNPRIFLREHGYLPAISNIIHSRRIAQIGLSSDAQILMSLALRSLSASWPLVSAFESSTSFLNSVLFFTICLAICISLGAQSLLFQVIVLHIDVIPLFIDLDASIRADRSEATPSFPTALHKCHKLDSSHHPRRLRNTNSRQRSYHSRQHKATSARSMAALLSAPNSSPLLTLSSRLDAATDYRRFLSMKHIS